MPRLKKLTAFMINIVIHDETKRNYPLLFERAFKLQKIIKLNKINAATLLTFGKYNYDNQTYFYGKICRFIDIQPPYFDSSSRDICQDEEGNPTYIISENIKSNVKMIDFMLFPDFHMVIVDRKNISVNYINKFFEELFSDKEINDEFGSIAVNIIKTKQAIEDIINLSNMTSLEIILDRSNPVSLSKLDQEVQNSLKAQNADKISYCVHSSSNNLQPNELTKSFTRAAQTNGKVRARYINSNGHSAEVFSEEFPFEESYKYAQNDDIRTIFVKLGKKMLDFFGRR